MADGKGESRAGLANGGMLSPAPSAPQACRLWDTLRTLEDGLRADEVSVFTSSAYCRRFCEVLLQHTQDNTATEGLMLCADVYETALRSFANARLYLTTECEDVLLLLERLVLSCFEVVLSMSEDDLSSDLGERMKKSIIDSHEILSEFGNKHLEMLVDNINYGGAWKNPVLVKILSRHSVDPEEVNKWMCQEGLSFLQLRIKHLMKTNCIQQAMLLSKICSNSEETSSDFFFRQSFLTCLCTMLPDDEAFKEISKMSGQDILDTICNLESEGQINTAFILCTTYLTQQLQNEDTSCSWELTLFWSKLQRRIDSCVNTFLERCRQFGVIAKTCQHLFFLIKVVHTEAGDEGVPVSVMLCIRALQISSSETDATKTSVCKTIACLLPQDLEVRRACQLTEFLFEPTSEGLNILEELYLQPDQKNVEESSVISNSLRCELLLALKSHWLFDPEFWDWKTIKRHCLKLLGKDVSDTEEESYVEPSINEPDFLDALAGYDDHNAQGEESQEYTSYENENVKVKKPVGSSERYKRWLQYKFYCVICDREVIEARILHHAKMHLEDGIYTCPVCVKKFRKKEVFVPHVMDHMKMPMRHRPRKKNEIPKQATVEIPEPEADPDGYISFRALRDKNLQDRDVYPCPGTDCSRVFKQFKYLSIHLKAEHQNNDENAKHYLDLKNMREKCAYCRRHFITNFHLRQHMRIHIGSHPFMCVSIDCNERFKTVNELLHHKHTHLDLQYKCELEGCHLVFSDLGLLYHHEAQHFRDAAYTCTFPRCKKFYYCKSDLQDHITIHLAHSENSFGNGMELFNNLKNEVGVPDNSFNYMPALMEKNILSCKEIEPVSENVDEQKFEVKTEPCLHHGMGPDCTLTNELKGQTDTEKLDTCTCEMSDSANALKQECLYSSFVEELPEKPHETESLCSVTKPNEVHIKLEEEEIPTSEGFTTSASSEDIMFELLTSLKQLNLKNVDTCVQETVADSSNSSTITQKRSTKKQEKFLNQYLSQLSSKPFLCEFKGCKSAFVTKAALLLHYCKKHEYTKEKALKLSIFQRRYSPFECHICQRRFTRRTLLRIHYRNDHHVMKEKARTNAKKFDKKMKPRIMHQKRKGCWEKLLTNESSSQSNDRTSPLQEGFNSETYADSLSDETDGSNTLGGFRPDDLASAEGRGSRRVVDKDKSCYVLDKYHKPFHCIHKSCNASFTSQRGLVRHYQLVHQYNRESLCLEKDKELKKKETNKCRRIFTCKYEECRKSFICGKALSTHYKQFHDHGENEEKEVDGFDNENFLQSETDEDEEKFSEESESDESEIYCDVEGCTAVFKDHTNYSRHIMTRHRKYNLYESRRKRKKKAQEVDENYIEPKHHKSLFQRKSVKIQNSAGKKEVIEFKTRKEALQMCSKNIDSAQFPCMLHGCSSVVKLESSIIRHYKLTHHLGTDYVGNHTHELVYCIKNFSKDTEEYSSPEEGPKGSDHIQDHKITRLSLRSSNIGTSNESDSYNTSNSDRRKNGSVERDFYGTSPHHNKISNVKESEVRSPNRRNDDRTSKSSGKENISSFYTGDKEVNHEGVNLQDPPESDLLDSKKYSPQEQVQAAIGLTNFKPMGFESSFLKFLQENRNSDEDDDDESESDEWNFPQKRRRQNSVQSRKRSCKDRNEREICLSLGKTASSEPTLENLRTMLDKALTDCGDLALKQLHQLYQKPVVVLERSDFTAPLLDLFSSKKTDQLCVGIS
ncbi:PREDICTED: zinc finger protein Rlf [Nanorana parkeri]|uniref:zinc finger protein Rlf n=1 Tax=Nanorana parkeri TaxID=125878 RepID=UPI0008540321|nr:PREDICTED: zinc finger protein Rlf [Nanorana parkeri]